MLMLAAIPITCWLCALIAKPRRPSPGNEVQEFVYSRLLGRHQQLSLLVLIVTAGAFLIFVLSLSPQADPTLNALRDPHRRCTQSYRTTEHGSSLRPCQPPPLASSPMTTPLRMSRRD
jgi:hypothetical protein